MKTMFLAAVCAVLASCADQTEPVQLPPVNLPVLNEGVQTARLARDAVVITVQSDGTVHAGGRPTTLAQLPRGKTMRLRIDRDAPWAHVQWLVFSIGHQNGRVRLQLAFVSNGGAECVLDSSVVFPGVGLPPSSGFDRSIVQMTVIVLAAEQFPEPYRCGERRAKSPNTVGSWIREAQSWKGDARHGVGASIRPHPLAPWGTVAAVYQQMRAANLLYVEFDGYTPLRRLNRTLERLRAPKAGEPWKSTGSIGYGRLSSRSKRRPEFQPYDGSPEMGPEVLKARND